MRKHTRINPRAIPLSSVTHNVFRVLLVFHSQTAENRAGHWSRPIGESHSNVWGVDVVQAAGIDDDVNALKNEKERHVTWQQALPLNLNDERSFKSLWHIAMSLKLLLICFLMVKNTKKQRKYTENVCIPFPYLTLIHNGKIMFNNDL